MIGYLNQFEKVNIRMETFPTAYSFGLEDLFVCEQGFQKKQWFLNPGVPTRVP